LCSLLTSTPLSRARRTATKAKAAKKVSHKQHPKTPRLYVKGIFLGFQRSKVNQNTNTALVRLEGVQDKKDTAFYLGKRVAYVYRAQNEKRGKVRCIWGRIARPHGNSGVVRAKFQTNLPPRAMGSRLRVMLYPSRI